MPESRARSSLRYFREASITAAPLCRRSDGFFPHGGALFGYRLPLEDSALGPRALARSGALLTLAYLAKPVAALGVVPVLAVSWQRLREGIHTRPTAIVVLAIVPLIVLWLYDRRIASYAEWHWASGITSGHASFRRCARHFRAPPASPRNCRRSARRSRSFASACSAPSRSSETLAAFVALPWIPARSRALLWAWLASASVGFIVVTVERVDYYTLPLVPLCALVLGGAAARAVRGVLDADAAAPARWAVLSLVPLFAVAVLLARGAPPSPPIITTTRPPIVTRCC